MLPLELKEPGIFFLPIAIAATAMGMLMKNMSLQSIAVSAPPNTGPATAPIA